jgi:cytoskeletal protein CcmA (bactofilin family)
MTKSSVTICILSLLIFAILPASAARFWDHTVYRDPTVTQPGRMEWAWDGSKKLAVGVPAIVHYSEQGAPRVVITGPDDMLRHVRFGEGTIVMDNDNEFSWNRDRLDITVTGIVLNDFIVSGSSKMLLGRLQRDSLSILVSGSGSAELDAAVKGDAKLVVSGSGRINFGNLQAQHLQARISGSGAIDGKGRADSLDLDMSGSGHFGDIASSRANVTMSGSGRAAIAPRDEAHVRISGSATVRMPAKPPQLETTVSGSGHVITVMAD